MKTFRGTGLFALFVCVLALISYFMVYQGEKKNSEAKEKASILIPYSEQELSQLTIEPASGAKLELKKIDSRWHIVAPVESLADQSEAKIFIDGLLSEKSIDQLREDEGITWSVFGLDKPAGSVTATNQAGQAKKLLISTRKTYSGDLYLRYENENKLLLASGAWSTYLAKEAKGLRDKRIFKGDPAKISEIMIKSPKGTIHLVRRDEKWVFKGDAQTVVDSSQVKKYLEHLQEMRALDFVAESHDQDHDLKKYDLTSGSSVKVDLVEEGGKSSAPSYSLTMSPVNKEGHAYVIASDLKPVFEVFKTAADKLHVEAGDFRDKAIPFEFKAEDARKLTYRSSLFSVELVKENGAWKLKDPKEGDEVAKDQVESLIKQLKALRVQRFLGHTKGKGLNPAKNLISLRDGEDKLLINFRWGEEFKEGEANLVYANSSLSTETLALDSVKVKELPGQTLLKPKKDKPAEKPAEKQTEKSTEKPTDGEN